jgi:hypothetical protein
MMRHAFGLLALAVSFSAAAADEAWTVAGQQGLVRVVIVPTALATDQAAYAAQVKRLCDPGATCFLNFYTNSTGAPVALPLPDAIERESTAVYRRSSKQVVERLSWRCSLKMVVESCF